MNSVGEGLVVRQEDVPAALNPSRVETIGPLTMNAARHSVA